MAIHPLLVPLNQSTKSGKGAVMSKERQDPPVHWVPEDNVLCQISDIQITMDLVCLMAQ